MTIRTLQRVIPSVSASDGAGVKLRRSLGSGNDLRHDPFLMLDEFYSDDPQDYLAGFPSHPHRGFETVTYMLDGHMQHQDSIGNRGDLGPGDVQWMTAARGIIHSEMPQQTEGRMRGFQLWINLPAADKMKPASYQDVAASDIPSVEVGHGGRVRVIAGTLDQDGRRIEGAVRGGATQPLYFDVALPAQASFEAAMPLGHNAFVYAYEGDVRVGDGDGEPLPNRAAGLLSDGDRLQLRAGERGARVLVLAAKPLHEPVVQYGPFVMNTRAEIEQAVRDFQNGRLAA
jgi:quercetin 2,3-dioxygenase